MASNTRGLLDPSGSPRLPIQFVSNPVLENLSLTDHTSQENQLSFDQEIQELLFTMFQQAGKTKKGPSVLSLQSPKRVGSWANNQSETLKKLHSVGTFQNGINAHVKGSFKKNDYLAKIDLQDAYLKVENTINTFTSHEGTPLWSLLAKCLASQAPQECSQNY